MAAEPPEPEPPQTTVSGILQRAPDQPTHPTGRWWRYAGRSRRHIYYRAATNLQGTLLFALIAVLGAIALGVATVHVLHLHTVRHDDAVLGTIGLAMLALGTWQGAKLALDGK
ncbi:hypothetical protein [Novosphingobium lentum]|uniref:hypothetical protein n=1 Tax=Novosphingobium lentum TaxID=145287 RepID=UPI00082C3B55|nr:hypothetical protein [Novosphingobium lentum]